MINYCLYYDKDGTLLAYKLTGEEPSRVSRPVERTAFLNVLDHLGIKEDITKEEERIDPEESRRILDRLAGIIDKALNPPVAYALKLGRKEE